MDTTTAPGGPITLAQFAERVGCHISTASRLRNGHRVPNRPLLDRIVTVFDLDPTTTLSAFLDSDPKVFGRFLNDHIFDAAPGDPA